MNNRLYTTSELAGLRAIATKDCEIPFIVKTFYPNQVIFETDSFAFEKLDRQTGFSKQPLTPTPTTTVHAIERNKMLRTNPASAAGHDPSIIATLRAQHDEILRREEKLAIDDLTKAPILISLADLGAMCTKVQTMSGYTPDVAVFDPIAWAKLSAIYDVSLAKIGSTSIFLYQDYYTDEAGNLHQMMPDNTMILGNTSAGSTMLYGEIDGVSGTRVSKMWIDAKDGLEYMQTSSAPMPHRAHPDAVICATIR